MATISSREQEPIQNHAASIPRLPYNKTTPVPLETTLPQQARTNSHTPPRRITHTDTQTQRTSNSTTQKCAGRKPHLHYVLVLATANPRAPPLAPITSLLHIPRRGRHRSAQRRSPSPAAARRRRRRRHQAGSRIAPRGTPSCGSLRLLKSRSRGRQRQGRCAQQRHGWPSPDALPCRLRRTLSETPAVAHSRRDFQEVSASEREHDEEEQEIEIEAARERARRGESERERREKNGSRKRVSRWLVAGPSMAWRSGGGERRALGG